MESQLATMQYPQKLNLQLNYVQELLKLGETGKALKGVEEIRENLQKFGIKLPAEIKNKLDVLNGMIHLRKAELDNYLNNHSEEACILPFSDKALHTEKEGSQNAIPHFVRGLSANRNDYKAIWLLNVAHHTLNQKFQGLNPEWEIEFDSKKNSEWKNISGGLGVDVNGLAGGSITDDFNNDGFIDIICSSWGVNDFVSYFENDGKGGFIDKSKASGLYKVHGGLNITHADYNNDGFIDLFVMRGGWFEGQGKIPNSLLRNNGDGTFTDVTYDSGVYAKAPTQSSSWMDVNLDGWLDLFVANESAGENIFPVEFGSTSKMVHLKIMLQKWD